MNKVGSNDITSKQLTYILVGTMLGIGAFRLPSSIGAVAYQDSWISAAIGGIYPLAMVILGVYFIKKFPDKNILMLSKDCFGIGFGTALNALFAAGFIVHLTTVTEGLCNLFLVTLMAFMQTYKLLIFILFVAAYAAYKDLRILGRVNAWVFFLTVAMAGILMFAFRGGDPKNIFPILGNGIPKILQGSREVLSSYTGIEILFLIYPSVTDKEKTISASFKAVLIIVIIYTWFVFISIYFLGVDILPKYIWSLTVVPKAIQIPVVSNFRLIFLVLWSIIVFKTMANAFFATAFILKDCTKNVPKKSIFIFIYILGLLISIKYKDEVVRRALLKQIFPINFIFNFGYIFLILLITLFKKGEYHETN